MVKIGSWWFMMLKKLGPSKKNIYEYSCFFPCQPSRCPQVVTTVHRGVSRFFVTSPWAPHCKFLGVQWIPHGEPIGRSWAQKKHRQKSFGGPFGAAGGGPPKCFRILGDFFCDLIIIWHRDVTRAHGPGAQAVCLVQPPVFSWRISKNLWQGVKGRILKLSDEILSACICLTTIVFFIVSVNIISFAWQTTINILVRQLQLFLRSKKVILFYGWLVVLRT